MKSSIKPVHLLSFFLLTSFFSLVNWACNGSSNSMGDDSSTLEVGANQAGIMYDDQVFVPTKTEGTLKIMGDSVRLNIKAIEKTSGFLLEVVCNSENLKGEHPFSQTGAQLVLNDNTGGTLVVYTTKECRGPEGSIVIEKYDSENQIVSGYFSAKTCASPMFGDLGDKEISSGKFNAVKLLVY